MFPSEFLKSFGSSDSALSAPSSLVIYYIFLLASFKCPLKKTPEGSVSFQISLLTPKWTIKEGKEEFNCPFRSAIFITESLNRRTVEVIKVHSTILPSSWESLAILWRRIPATIRSAASDLSSFLAMKCRVT